MSQTKNKDFNRNHPELRPDEVFISNASDNSIECIDDGRSSWDAIGWTSKRRGQVSYDIEGKSLGKSWPGSFPVFAKQSEIKAAGRGILKRLLP